MEDAQKGEPRHGGACIGSLALVRRELQQLTGAHESATALTVASLASFGTVWRSGRAAVVQQAPLR